MEGNRVLLPMLLLADSAETMNTVMEIGDIYLKQTCEFCPEQYMAFVEDANVGYMRLRWGHFTVSVPGESGKVGIFSDDIEVFEHLFDDDYMGCFDNQEVRDYFLTLAKEAIADHFNKLAL